MNNKEHDFNEPWPIYDDQEKPWLDYERLLKLHDKMETQAEIGDALGCTPSTISYHLDKAVEEVEPDYDEEELRCIHFDQCGNFAPAPNNGICDLCLDLVRHNDSLPDPLIEASIEELYDEYEQFAEQREDSKEES